MSGAKRQENLAVVALHGLPEVTGLALKESERNEPAEGWDVEVGNQAAVDAGVRYVRHNVAVSFPGDIHSHDYELRRPAELLRLAKDRNTVLDVHDRPTATGEYVLINPESDRQLLRVAKALVVGTVVLTRQSEPFVSHAPNVLTTELCRANEPGKSDRIARNVARLRYCMRLVTQGTLPDASPSEFRYYELVQEIHSAQAEALGLYGMGTLAPFDPIPPEIIKRLDLPEGDYAAQYWNGHNSSEGEWFGGVLQAIKSPFD